MCTICGRKAVKKLIMWVSDGDARSSAFIRVAKVRQFCKAEVRSSTGKSVERNEGRLPNDVKEKP